MKLETEIRNLKSAHKRELMRLQRDLESTRSQVNKQRIRIEMLELDNRRLGEIADIAKLALRRTNELD